MNVDLSVQSSVPFVYQGSPVFTRVTPKPSYRRRRPEWFLPPGSIEEVMTHQALPPLIRHSRPSASAFKYYPFSASAGEEDVSPPKGLQKQTVFTIQPMHCLDTNPDVGLLDYTAVQPFYCSPESCKSVELTGGAMGSITHSDKKKLPFANVARELSDEDVDLGYPPVEDLPRIKGYEDITFESTTVFPPATEEQGYINKSLMQQNVAPASIPELTEEEARAALMDHVTSKCTYVRSVAREMVIRKMDSCPGYQYTLESFTEMRQVSWSYEPYTGDTTPENSLSTDLPPEAWDIPCPCPSYFHNHVTITEVPNTSTVRTCHSCGGIGRRRCNACNTSGWENCHYCHGDGLKVSLQGHRERCYVCVGSGRKKCWKCSGDGMAACKACGGTGQIRCYIALTVTWTNHMEEHVEEPTTAIRDKLENASGHLVLEEEMHQISPIGKFPEKSIIETSAKLLEKHRTAFSSEKILMQRHRVKTIPVTSVSYQWKNHVGLYFVYGIERKIYAPDYPEASCCVLI